MAFSRQLLIHNTQSHIRYPLKAKHSVNARHIALESAVVYVHTVHKLIRVLLLLWIMCEAHSSVAQWNLEEQNI